jgi:DNA helicase HerA-like ATPase
MNAFLAIDEAKQFAPSVTSVPSKAIIKQLANMIRKYNVGLILATQEPNSIDNTIMNNCSVKLSGVQSSSAAQGSIEKIFGGSNMEFSKLRTGEFYFHSSVEGKYIKLKTKFCLSYHPPSAPSIETVLEIARKSRKIVFPDET